MPHQSGDADEEALGEWQSQSISDCRSCDADRSGRRCHSNLLFQFDNEHLWTMGGSRSARRRSSTSVHCGESRLRVRLFDGLNVSISIRSLAVEERVLFLRDRRCRYCATSQRLEGQY